MLDAWLNDTLAFNRTTCTLAFQNLTLCSTDKGSNSTGSNTTSLRVRQECCSAACAVGVEQVHPAAFPACTRHANGCIDPPQTRCVCPHPPPWRAVLSQALITSGPGCFRAFTGAVCDSQHNSSLAEPLFGLAQRCLGVNASCTALAEPGSLLPPELQARSQLGVVPLDPMLDLVPDQPPADSLLATVEEIGQVASQGGGGRRMLARRQEVVGSGR